MLEAKTPFLLELPGDRPPTPPRSSNKNGTYQCPESHQPQLNLSAGSTTTPVGKATSRPMPANPPSSPATVSNTCSRPSSPTLTARGSQKSPYPLPITPPRTPPPIQTLPSFKFSKRVMKSKKLSSSVHGAKKAEIHCEVATLTRF